MKLREIYHTRDGEKREPDKRKPPKRIPDLSLRTVWKQGRKTRCT